MKACYSHTCSAICGLDDLNVTGHAAVCFLLLYSTEASVMTLAVTLDCHQTMPDLLRPALLCIQDFAMSFTAVSCCQYWTEQGSAAHWPAAHQKLDECVQCGQKDNTICKIC